MPENTEPTSLQFRLLQKQIDDLSPLAKARREYIARLQRLRPTPEVPTP
jgi:hypothetical protein